MSCTRPRLAQCKPFLPSWSQVTASTFKINLFREINNPSSVIRWFSAVLDLATCCLSHVKQGPQTEQSKVMFCPQVPSACVADNTHVKRTKSMARFISTQLRATGSSPRPACNKPFCSSPHQPHCYPPPKKRNTRKLPGSAHKPGEAPVSLPSQPLHHCKVQEIALSHCVSAGHSHILISTGSRCPVKRKK